MINSEKKDLAIGHNNDDQHKDGIHGYDADEVERAIEFYRKYDPEEVEEAMRFYRSYS